MTIDEMKILIMIINNYHLSNDNNVAIWSNSFEKSHHYNNNQKNKKYLITGSYHISSIDHF
ncbi:hypothetical protein DERP_001721 [Dermatophagoides pteronyssinus]|uniref:Uncharacterized protein n=1 Tax=Dermatophagoides pteronyssinus TaxID=6956 RepID=A0ABQ8JBB6_DERPT|nr:hypothetical protein DERP_001721 [Dermatophagoides pteronyssinus]